MKDGIKIFISILVLIAIVALCIYFGKNQSVDVQNEVQEENVEIIEENEEEVEENETDNE